MSNESRNAVIYINGTEVNNTMRSIEAHARKLRGAMVDLTRGTDEYERKVLELRNTNKIIAQHRQAVSGVSDSWAGVTNKLKGWGSMLMGYLGGTAIIGGMRSLIQKNVELSDAQTAVQRTTQLNDKQVQELEKRFSEFNTRTPRLELLKLAEEAGKQGKNTVDSVATFVDEMNKAKIALGGDLGEGTIESLGKLTTIFDTSSLKIGNAIKAIADNSIASAPYQVDFMMRTAGVANTVKITADELLGYGAVLENLGQNQEVSGTAINQFLLKLTSNTEEFGNIAGFAKGELSQLIGEKGTNAGFVAFLEKLKGSSTGTQDLIQKLNDLGLDGTRNAAVLLTLANNTELLAKQQVIAKENIGETTLVMDSYNKSNSNFAANWQIFMKNVGAFFMNSQVGQGFIRLVGNLVDVRTEAQKTTDAFKSQKASVKAMEKEIIPLRDRYIELQSIAHRNKEEQTELDKIIATISSKLPDAVTKWNKYGNAIAISTEKINQSIAAQKEQERLLNADAISDSYSEIENLIRQIDILNAKKKAGVVNTTTSGSGMSGTSRALTKEELSKLAVEADQLKAKLVKNYTEIEATLGQTLSVADQLTMQLYGVTSTGVNLTSGYFNQVTEKATTAATVTENATDAIIDNTDATEKNNETKTKATDIIAENKNAVDKYVDSMQAINEQVDAVINSEYEQGLQDIDTKFIALVGYATQYGYSVEDVINAWATAIINFKKEMAGARAESGLMAESFAAMQKKVSKQKAASDAESKKTDEEKQQAKESYIETTLQAGAAAVESAENEKEAIKNVITTIREAIKQRIMQAIAEAIAGALATVPFPFNIILATTAGAAASALFDQVVPGFKDGTENAPRGWKLVGEEGPELIYDNGGYGIMPARETANQLNWMNGSGYRINANNAGNGGGNNYDFSILIREVVELKKISARNRHVIFPDQTVKKFDDRLDLLTKMNTKIKR
jgi:TP901 family phage tail tape measure protein